MEREKKILLVGDDPANRELLKTILETEYEVAEAEDSSTAFAELSVHNKEISLVLLDLKRTAWSNTAFLKKFLDNRHFHGIPVIVSVESDTADEQTDCLDKGAWDYIRKPYLKELVLFRVRNVIETNELAVYRELKYREMYDPMTGIYTREKFFEKTREVIDRNSEKKFVFVRFDIHKFQLINQFFGVEEGDRLIRYVADDIAQDAMKIQEESGDETHPVVSYGHIGADVFCTCVPYKGNQDLREHFQTVRNKLCEYGLGFEILPVFGVYIIEDPGQSVSDMYDKAHMAAKCCKGNYVDNYAFYDESMRKMVVDEQGIINDMSAALETGQFILYLQPKYNIKKNVLDGAEVLVRWQHPTKGMISPGAFIPVFERNGFIVKLDYYVWEETCKLIRRWLDEGETPYPVSVNMSRVSLYNPKLADILCELVEQYEISPSLLQLELTESAYMNNPIAIRDTMSRLQNNGFTILMDDFGNGYSSLNALKDIAVDILKMDMGFVARTEFPERGRCIMASVIRMAKQLDMPVIVEGVETKVHLEFLKSIGCEYVQGFYFARPMPVKEYEKLAYHAGETVGMVRSCQAGNVKLEGDLLYAFNEQMDIVFLNSFQPLSIYEYSNGEVEVIRVNNAHYETFGYNNVNVTLSDDYRSGVISEEARETVLAAFEHVVRTQETTVFEYKRKTREGRVRWVQVNLKFIGHAEDKYILLGMLMDITAQKEIDAELSRYRQVFSTAEKPKTLLVVEDQEISRGILINIFGKKYRILEAENGQKAFDVLDENGKVDLILLDLIMPVMNGEQFLLKKRTMPEYRDIPVVIISADNEPKQQMNLMKLGVSDYIVKPFVPEVVEQRVYNVLSSVQWLGEVHAGDESQKSLKK